MMKAFVWLVLIFLSIPTHADWLGKLNEVLEEGTIPNIQSTSISNVDMTKAFKEALRIGSDQVVQQLSQTGGFNDDPAVHISLPRQLKSARKWLDKVGMRTTLEDLESKLNSAAEQATPEAKALFINAIKEMSFDDIRQIYSGPEDSATRYFQSKMTPKLTEKMRPVVSSSLSDVGAVKRLDELVNKYKSFPMVPDIKADLTTHVVDGGLKGIFHYLAKQEAAIRNDPAQQTTALLKKVFGAK